MPNPIPTASRLLVDARDGHQCFLCGGRKAHWHHRRTRRIRDDHTHDTCNGLSLCTVCHAWAHAHPREAIKLGLILSRYVQRPWLHPVQHFRHGWVLLECHSPTFTLTEEPT